MKRRMDKEEDLTLMGSWILPNGPVTYRDEDRFIYAEFRNNTDKDIVITGFKYSFETEPTLPENMMSFSEHCLIQAKCINKITARFHVDLSLRAYTNLPIFKVEYEIDGSTHNIIEFDRQVTRHAIIHHIPSHQKTFFISHRDPVDREKAKTLDYYLQKIGFRGYVAEENPQPGSDLWSEKILPEIKNCMGLIVLWTTEATQKPEVMCREIQYAQEQGKRIIPLVEKDLDDIPWILQEDNERIHTGGKVTDSDLVKLVDLIHQMYFKGYFLKL